MKQFNCSFYHALMRFYLSTGLSLLLVSLTVGCGSDSPSAGAIQPVAHKKPVRVPTAEEARSRDWKAMKRIAGPLAGRLLIPSGSPPGQVVFKELKRGSGPVIKHNQPFRVRYVNFDYSTGRVFESVWHGAAPILIWNINKIVDGWIPGLRGMRAGGAREVIVPSSWAYESGALVYLVKLVALG